MKKIKKSWTDLLKNETEEEKQRRKEERETERELLRGVSE